MLLSFMLDLLRAILWQVVGFGIIYITQFKIKKANVGTQTNDSSPEPEPEEGLRKFKNKNMIMLYVQHCMQNLYKVHSKKEKYLILNKTVRPFLQYGTISPKRLQFINELIKYNEVLTPDQIADIENDLVDLIETIQGPLPIIEPVQRKRAPSPSYSPRKNPLGRYQIVNL